MLCRPAALSTVVRTILLASGSDRREADILCDHLVGATLLGHESHGVIRLPQYVEAVRAGTMFVNRRPATLFESDSILVLDGQRGYGQVVALEATDQAIAKAKSNGVVMLTLRNAGHFGRMGAWAERAAAAGQATIYFANAARPGGAGLAPFGGTDRRIHAGPICLGMPVAGDDPIVLDMSTAAVAIGKIRVARNQGERLREACIVGPDGALSDDPATFFGPHAGPLVPFGGHKGYGLCLFTDLFGGILGGGGAKYDGVAGDWFPTNSMMAIHIAPSAFADQAQIADQVRSYIAWVAGSPPQPGAEVLVPGERGRRLRDRRTRDGVEIDDATWAQILAAGQSCGVAAEALDELAGAQD